MVVEDLLEHGPDVGVNTGLFQGEVPAGRQLVEELVDNPYGVLAAAEVQLGVADELLAARGQQGEQLAGQPVGQRAVARLRAGGGPGQVEQLLGEVIGRITDVVKHRRRPRPRWCCRSWMVVPPGPPIAAGWPRSGAVGPIHLSANPAKTRILQARQIVIAMSGFVPVLTALGADVPRRTVGLLRAAVPAAACGPQGFLLVSGR
ncbi:hypothetical protein AB0442_31645 [Kitasatospora sp. NPDC085895]|uniref:hypothetical protein n=1 Tax=Kitasatospora sp. NPDC085895 TaxID=3155057 RepID=UPI00344FDA6C